MSHSFINKTVVISGAAKGIGEGIARKFAIAGANLVISDYSKAIYETAEKMQNEFHQNIIPFIADVTKEDQVSDLYKLAFEKYRTVDVSIQNAGIITINNFEKMTRKEFDDVLHVNTTGVWLCCREAAKYMVKQKSGRLINTSSGQGRVGFIYTPHYAASKMGVIGITQSLALELAQHNITVNAFCPGIIETNMWDYNDRVWGEILSSAEKQYNKGELMEEWIQGVPLKRAGKPSDVAGLVTFLASEDAAYITGQTINVDGGLIMS